MSTPGSKAGANYEIAISNVTKTTRFLLCQKVSEPKEHLLSHPATTQCRAAA